MSWDAAPPCSPCDATLLARLHFATSLPGESWQRRIIAKLPRKKRPGRKEQHSVQCGSPRLSEFVKYKRHVDSFSTRLAPLWVGGAGPPVCAWAEVQSGNFFQDFFRGLGGFWVWLVGWLVSGSSPQQAVVGGGGIAGPPLNRKWRGAGLYFTPTVTPAPAKLEGSQLQQFADPRRDGCRKHLQRHCPNTGSG